MSRPFIDLLREHNRGATSASLTEAFVALIAACQVTQKSGALTLTVKVSPCGDEQVDVVADVSTKPPRVRARSLYFIDADGNAVRDDPRQRTLGFRDASEPPPLAPRTAIQAK